MCPLFYQNRQRVQWWLALTEFKYSSDPRVDPHNVLWIEALSMHQRNKRHRANFSFLTVDIKLYSCLDEVSLKIILVLRQSLHRKFLSSPQTMQITVQQRLECNS